MIPTEYGYYFGEGRVQVTSQNVWKLIDEAVTEAEALDVHDVMVGPMKNLLVLDYLDEEDVEDMQADDCLTPQRIVELVDERHWEAIWEGQAHLDQRAIESFPGDAPSNDILRWASDHIELDPSYGCIGRDPLPVQYFEGEWTFGVNNPNAWATITYENSQWHWVSFGQFGDAKTLEEAMHHSKCVVIGETERPAPIDRLARIRAKSRTAC